MGSHEASRVTMESIRERMVEVEKIHRQGGKVAITDILIKDIGWLFRRIAFLTNQVRKLEAELETSIKEKKELSNNNIMAQKVEMLLKRVQQTEERLRIEQQEKAPLKRENNTLRQEKKLLLARAQKAEKRAQELAARLSRDEEETTSGIG